MKRKKEGMGFFLFVFFRTPREQKKGSGNEKQERRKEKLNRKF